MRTNSFLFVSERKNRKIFKQKYVHRKIPLKIMKISVVDTMIWEDEYKTPSTDINSIALTKLCSSSDQKKLVWYFSYGANMSKSFLWRRHTIRTISSVPAISLSSEHNSLSFCHRGGFATLVRKDCPTFLNSLVPPFNESVHGVLH